MPKPKQKRIEVGGPNPEIVTHAFLFRKKFGGKDIYRLEIETPIKWPTVAYGVSIHPGSADRLLVVLVDRSGSRGCDVWISLPGNVRDWAEFEVDSRYGPCVLYVPEALTRGGTLLAAHHGQAEGGAD